MYTDAEVRSYLSRNLNKNTFMTFMKIFNLDNDLYRRVIDKLIEYRITISDLENIPFTNEDLNNYLDSYELQFVSYVGDPLALVDGYNYLVNTLNLSPLLIEGIENSVSHSYLDLVKYIRNISIREAINVKTYKDINSFRSEFDAHIWSKFITRYSITSSMEEIFPVTDLDIEALFSSLTKTYTYDSVAYTVKDLGIRIYKEIFNNFINPTNYFTNENIIFLLYNINTRLSKLEINSPISSSMLNIVSPNENITTYINQEAINIETMNTEPDDVYIENLLGNLHILDFTKNLSNSMTKLKFIDSYCENYYTHTLNPSAYNEHIKDMYDILLDKINKFRDLILYSHEISIKYLIT
jgi:hypothetical protein